VAPIEPQPASDTSTARTFFDWTVDDPSERLATREHAPSGEPSVASTPAGGAAALGSADYGVPARPPRRSGDFKADVDRRVA
jgi:hypothetical protein